MKKKNRRCRGSNPGHPRDRREYSPLYYNDLGDSYFTLILKEYRRLQFVDIQMWLCDALKVELFFINPIELQSQ